MKKRAVAVFMCLVMVAGALAGCGKKDDSKLADRLEDISDKAGKASDKDDKKDKTRKRKQEETTEAPDEQSEAPETEAAEAPEYCITEAIAPEYEEIHIVNDDPAYMELGNSLEELNSKIKDKGWNSDAKYSWQKIYVRRGDADILSLACEYREVGGEHDYVEVSGHTYDVKSGKELKLSDIVDDEKAFRKLLTNNVHDAVMREMILYAGNTDVEDFDAAPAIEECIKDGRYGWVLDPQGVTFWFRGINALIGHISTTVLFTDDKTGDVFNKDIVAGAPDEWIMQIPGNYISNGFDCEDDGYMDTMEWCRVTEYDDNGESIESGIDINYNDRYYPDDEICPPDKVSWSAVNGMLLHKDGKSVFMLQYSAEAEPWWKTFTLENDNVKAADSISVSREMAMYSKEDPAGYIVPTDMSAIKVYSETGGETRDTSIQEYISVDTNGKITLRKEEAGGDGGSGDEGGFDVGGLNPEEFDPDLFAYKFGGSVIAYECHDYDGDGTKEAFVCMGHPDDMGGNEVETIWFIAHDGKTTQMDIGYAGIALYESAAGYYQEYKKENKGFFTGECGGYGSGWQNFLFSVEDGEPYELDVSMRIQGFYQDEPGVFYTTTDDFTDGHAYMITELNYDEKSGQFEIGKVTNRNWLDE